MQSVCLKEAGVKPDDVLAEETTLIQQTFGGYLQSKVFQFINFLVSIIKAVQ